MAERTTEQRIADLEARVAVLEEGAAAERAEDPEETVDDTFAVLREFKRSAGEGGGVVYAGSLPGEGNDGTLDWQYGLPLERIDGTDWSRLAPSIDALGNPVRLSILHQLWNSTSTVAELADLPGFGTTGQIYHHINQLMSAGWLTTTRRGHYTVPPERVVPLLVILTAAGGPL